MAGPRYYLPVPVAEWSISGAGDNAPASVTRPGESGKSHYITYVGGSYSGNVVGGEMLLKDAAKVVGDYFVHNQRGVPLTYPLKISEGSAVSLSIAAGGLGVRGVVTLQGYTS